MENSQLVELIRNDLSTNALETLAQVARTRTEQDEMIGADLSDLDEARLLADPGRLRMGQDRSVRVDHADTGDRGV